MSGIRKLLLGGAVCCLIASLIIPLPSGNGTDTNSEVSAGVGPKFRKPWLKKRASSKKKSVKSYPIPKEDQTPQPQSQPKSQPKLNPRPELDLLTQPAETVDSGSPKSVMQELQELYEQNGQQAPVMTPFESQPQQHRPQAQHRTKKSKNIFSRAYEKLTGKFKSRPAPEELPVYEPEGLPDWEKSDLQPKDIVSSEMEPLEDTESADIILPPQPQPNFLPGLDLSDVEDIKPAITEGIEILDENDPFPLPPLPDEVGVPSASKPGRTNVVHAPEKPATGGNSFDVTLPLPGIDSGETAFPETVEASPQPEQSEQMEKQEFSEPVLKIVEQESDESSFNELESDDNLSKMSIKGKKENNLPPAPSAIVTTPSLSKKTTITTRVPATYQGWRSRDGQPLRLEPNTLNAPVEARPAALPNPAVVHKEDTSDKYRRIAERGERTGFKGFCPVVLRDDLELVDASPAYRIEYEGSIYYLSSAKALEQFQASPMRYAPAWGGIDLVKYNTEGVEKAGRLDYAVWYHDRLHLFSSQESMEQFKSAPDSFVVDN